MSRSTYDVKEEYLGDGSLSAYTFDFKIEALSQLEIVEVNDLGVETQRVRGTDVIYLSSVTFDAVYGAGTVNLTANLTAGYTLLILLANDAPTQPSEFRDAGDFTLSRIGAALDFITGAVQRLAYKGKQGLRIHDADDEETFNTQFDKGATDAPGQYLKVNDAGDGFEYGLDKDGLKTYIVPDGTIVGQVRSWIGGVWVAALRGGGQYVSATQSIVSSAQIAVNIAIQQLLKVQGDAGDQTTDTSPFSGTLVDGMVITLLGISDVNVLKIPYSDTTDGCMLKGDCYLRAASTLTLVYDIDTRRFYEIARN